LDWRKSSGTFPDFSVIFTFSAGDTGTMAPFILEGSSTTWIIFLLKKLEQGV
jgi:hypothetical protein